MVNIASLLLGVVFAGGLSLYLARFRGRGRLYENLFWGLIVGGVFLFAAGSLIPAAWLLPIGAALITLAALWAAFG